MLRLRSAIYFLYRQRYKNLTELAEVMGISPTQVYRVKQGTRHINEKFILGALKAFPGYSLGELFYVEE